eukprot:3699726-Pyramimonas_sp.AAC.1
MANPLLNVGLAEGDVIAVRYGVVWHRIWHERVILLIPAGALPIVSILIRDGDQYDEDLSAGGDIQEFAILEGGALGRDAAAIGTDHVQRFRDVPLPA